SDIRHVWLSGYNTRNFRKRNEKWHSVVCSEWHSRHTSRVRCSQLSKRALQQLTGWNSRSVSKQQVQHANGGEWKSVHQLHCRGCRIWSVFESNCAGAD